MKSNTPYRNEMNKKWKVLIHSMTFNRDFGMAFILSRLLEHLGCECMIVNNTNLTSIPVKFWNPDAVFYVTPGNTEKLIRNYPHAKLFLFSAEGSVTYEINESKIAAAPDLLSRFSRIYLWGEKARHHLLNKYMETEGAKENIFESIFKVVGNMRGDIVKYRKSKNISGKIKIGFTGSFWLINSIKKDLYLLKYLFDKKEDAYMLGESILQIKYLKVMLGIFDRLEKDKFEISLRPHPLEKKNIYQNIDYVKTRGISINESIDFSTWAAEQDIIIGNSISTTISLLAIAKTPFINLTLLCGSNLNIYDNILPSQLLTAIAKYSPSNFEDLFNTIANYDKQTFYDDDTETLLHELYDLKSAGSSISKAAVDVVNMLNENRSGIPLKSKLPFGIIKIMDYLNLKYRKFRNRDSIENDYSFFIYKDIILKAKEEFDQVIDNIINDPVNLKLIESSKPIHE